jgi:hypothetical protein
MSTRTLAISFDAIVQRTAAVRCVACVRPGSGHAAELIRCQLDIGGALPQSACLPVGWPFGSREYALIANDMELSRSSQLDERMF